MRRSMKETQKQEKPPRQNDRTAPFAGIGRKSHPGVYPLIRKDRVGKANRVRNSSKPGGRAEPGEDARMVKQKRNQRPQVSVLAFPLPPPPLSSVFCLLLVAPSSIAVSPFGQRACCCCECERGGFQFSAVLPNPGVGDRAS